MTTTLFTFVDLFRRHLDTTAHLLAKGSAFATEKGIAEADMLGWRLAEDMHPLSFQAMVVINFSQSWIARGIDVAIPDPVTADLDVAGYQAAIVGAKTWLAALTPEQFAGRDDVPVTAQVGPTMTPTLPAGHWITVFAATNIAFHANMVYAILRSNGVPLGKLDVFPTGL
ncbi:DUF1993 domain-containing protein [Sphingomonas sp. MMS24-J45]|uniref:DUF1993 domain-containing protein n=1 Tax=Sphingomonas sp. MMS24-J45 TaxID=3238806 RepID=UPI0038507F82